jgi:hypothetical protein
LILVFIYFVFLFINKSKREFLKNSKYFVFFLIIIGFYSTFYSGNFKDPKDTRFALISLPFIVLFSGFAIKEIFSVLSSRFKLTQTSVSIFIFIFVISFLSIEYSYKVKSIDTIGYTTFRNPRLDMNFIKELNIPENSYVYSYTPWLLHEKGISSGQIDLLYKNGHLSSRNNFSSIWLHYGYWCKFGGKIQKENCSNGEKLSTSSNLNITSDSQGFYMIKIQNP